MQLKRGVYDTAQELRRPPFSLGRGLRRKSLVVEMVKQTIYEHAGDVDLGTHFRKSESVVLEGPDQLTECVSIFRILESELKCGFSQGNCTHGN